MEVTKKKATLLKKICQVIYSLSIVNLLMLLVNIPLFFGLLFIEKNVPNTVPFIVSSVSIGPSIVATFTVLNKKILLEERMTCRLFFATYQENFKLSFVLSILNMLLNLLLFWNLTLILTHKNIICLFFPTLFIIGLFNFLFIQIYQILSRYQCSLPQVFLKSTLFLMKYPLVTIRTFLLFYGLFFIFISAKIPFLYFFICSVPLYIFSISTLNTLKQLEYKQKLLVK